MNRVRIWSEPNGTVKVQVFTEDIKNLDDYRFGINPAATFIETTSDQMASLLPPDRINRHKWRVREGRVVVDALVPDPLDPKQALRDAIGAAMTLADLKTVLKNQL